MILCIVDCDYCDFDDPLIRSGEEGGNAVAQRLTSMIAEDIARQKVVLSKHFSFWVKIFVNRQSMQTKYVYSGRCTQEQLDAFFNGFGQTSPRCMLVDIVGKERGSACVKIDGMSYILI